MKVALLLAAALAPSLAHSQDMAARNLAAPCAICHGTDGRTVTKDVVPLAGLPKAHIVTQMKAFREGTRPATVMHQLAKGYSEQQVEQIADYFAAQRR